MLVLLYMHYPRIIVCQAHVRPSPHVPLSALNGSHRTAGLVVAIYFKLAKLNSGALIHTQAHRDLYRDPKKVVGRGSWGFGLLRKPQASTRDIPEGAWSARALVALVAPAGELIRGCRPRGTQSLG